MSTPTTAVLRATGWPASADGGRLLVQPLRGESPSTSFLSPSVFSVLTLPSRSLTGVDRRDVSWVNQHHITEEKLDEAIGSVTGS